MYDSEEMLFSSQENSMHEENEFLMLDGVLLSITSHKEREREREREREMHINVESKNSRMQGRC